MEKMGKIFQKCLPFVGRFLLVLTFIEDAIRLIWQWDQQSKFLRRQGLTHGFEDAFLYLNILAQVIGAILVIFKIRVTPAIIGLITVMVAQGFVYSVFDSPKYVLTAFALTGGMLLAVADSSSSKKKSLFPGLPEMDQVERVARLQFFGRILFMCLLVSFFWNERSTWLTQIFIGIGLVVSLFVVFGFRAKMAAVALLVILLGLNLGINAWWDPRVAEYDRDFVKYEFFQVLSVGGGLLLLAHMGPGHISFDRKKLE